MLTYDYCDVGYCYAVRIGDYLGKPWFLFYSRITGEFMGDGVILRR